MDSGAAQVFRVFLCVLPLNTSLEIMLAMSLGRRMRTELTMADTGRIIWGS